MDLGTAKMDFYGIEMDFDMMKLEIQSKCSRNAVKMQSKSSQNAAKL